MGDLAEAFLLGAEEVLDQVQRVLGTWLLPSLRLLVFLPGSAVTTGVVGCILNVDAHSLSFFLRALPAALLALCMEDKCSLCEVEFNGPSISQSHYHGKAHARKVAAYLDNDEDIPKGLKPKKVQKSFQFLFQRLNRS